MCLTKSIMMKKIIPLTYVICMILLISCKKDNEANTNTISNGTVTISAVSTGDPGPCFARYECTIGLGYSSTDIANEAYFARSSLQTGNKVSYLSKSDLAPGTYYYRVKVAYVKKDNCDSDPKYFNDKIRSGAFDIIAGETTKISVILN
mgnify:CR=1 FL=1